MREKRASHELGQPGTEGTEMSDLARSIVRAVLDNLEDRRGIKPALLHCRYEDQEVYTEICDTLESIVDDELSSQ